MLILDKRIILVTGASRGIGLAIVKRLASEGAIVFAGMRNESNIMENEDVSSIDGKVIPIKLDVCDKESIKKCILEIKKMYGKLDVLVNNAGIMITGRMEMASDDAVDKVFNTNVFGLLHVSQMAIRLLKKSDAGTIINISSILGDVGDIGQTVYAASKAAVSSMTRTWAREYAPMGIRVNAIAPGNTDTDMFNMIDDDKLEDAIALIGLGRLAKPDEIAKVALFLASTMSSYVTGEIIGVNGGLIL